MIKWIEQGGPPLDGPPGTAGFGTQLVSRTVNDAFGGAVSYEWSREGLLVSLNLPLDALQR